jgi:hypothetical protein
MPDPKPGTEVPEPPGPNIPEPEPPDIPTPPKPGVPPTPHPVHPEPAPTPAASSRIRKEGFRFAQPAQSYSKRRRCCDEHGATSRLF